MALRDVVGGACGGGSSVTNLANDFLSTEKLLQDQGSWAAEYAQQHPGAPQMGISHGPGPLPQLGVSRSSLETSLEEEFLRESAMHDSMAASQEMMMHTPEMEEQIDFSLRMIFNSLQEGAPFQPPPIEAPLTPLQQDRMHHRLSVLSRHISSNPAASDQLVQTALHSLNIRGTGVPPPSMGRNWIGEFQEHHAPPTHLAAGAPGSSALFESEFERAFRGREIGGMARGPGLGASWANEFSQKQQQQQNFDAEWDRISKQHNIPTTAGGVVTAPSMVDQWVQEFQEEAGKGKEKEEPKVAPLLGMSEEERLLREEEGDWFGQFVPNGKKSQQSQDWINEFNEEVGVGGAPQPHSAALQWEREFAQGMHSTGK